MHGENGRERCKRPIARRLRNLVGQLLSLGGDLASSPGVPVGLRGRWSALAGSAHALVGEARRAEDEAAQGALPVKTERELELEVQLAAARAAFADRAKLAAELERDLVTLKQAVRSLLLGAHPDPFDGLDAAAVEDGLRALRLLVTPQQDGPAAAPVRS